MPVIDVLLSSYNGQEYLREQIDSILEQRCVTIRILARDDGSSDATPIILEEYAKRLGEKFIILHDPPGNVGVVKSFEALLKRSDSPFFAFCDQDDVWKMDKLSRSLAALEEVSEGGTAPILVYSDLEVVSETLETRAKSFFKFMKIQPSRARSVKALALQNCVVGCTVLGNRALKNLALPFPPSCVMHDWWIALCAAYQGQTVFIPDPTVRYRQHAANVVGARSVRSRIESAWSRRNSVLASIEQALALLDLPHFRSGRDTDYLVKLRRTKTDLSRKIFLIMTGSFKDGILRNLFLFILARAA